MEHVQDIEIFKSEVKRVLKPGGFLFWEVPNAEAPSNGAMNNKIQIPHTYYFKKSFFESWFDEVLLNTTFDSKKGIIENWENYEKEKGGVIRALGKIN